MAWPLKYPQKRQTTNAAAQIYRIPLHAIKQQINLNTNNNKTGLIADADVNAARCAL